MRLHHIEELTPSMAMVSVRSSTAAWFGRSTGDQAWVIRFIADLRAVRKRRIAERDIRRASRKLRQSPGMPVLFVASIRT
jgi:hypothetical protein